MEVFRAAVCLLVRSMVLSAGVGRRFFADTRITAYQLAANALFGWGWADPIAALLMVPWLVKEGFEGVRGESDDEN